MQDPPCKTVRKFLHLLEHSDADFEEELGNFLNHEIGKHKKNIDCELS